jgi:hypothetical protein
MHNLHTFEHRLSWFYTCVNRQGKEKPKKNTAQMRHSCTISPVRPPGEPSPTRGAREKPKKNTAQMRHSCTLSGHKPPEKLIRPPSEHNRDKCDKPAWNATIWKLPDFG